MARRLPPNVTRRTVWNTATIAQTLGTHRARVEALTKELFGREYGEFTDAEVATLRTHILPPEPKR